ncbi:ABC transporter permease [Schumannella soli]|nr:ABC transporter permease subunit [Schumannella soli]
MSAPRFAAEPSRATSSIILIAAAVLFLLPIVAMLEFSFRQGQRVDGVQNYGPQHWQGVFDPANSFKYQGLLEGIGNSLLICLLTVVIVLVLLLPVMILVELRFPKLRRVLEFICIIPITIPAIVLVVGYVPVYGVVAQIFGSVPWTIAFAAGIIVLPYAYRPIAANMAGVELTVLSEASRSLGAGWGRTLFSVILPNLRRGILASCFITIAVVLGEYTIAAFLAQNTFQTALVLINHTDSYVSVIFAVLALLFGFVLLLVIGRVGAVGTRRERRTRRTA